MGVVKSSGFLPHIILAGAPKCGTTSIFNHLKDHPQIYASSVKETYFLMDRGYPLFRKDWNIGEQGVSGYARFFSGYEEHSGKYRLEATPDYLYQRTPLESIPQWPLKPKIIFVLRRPEERVYSLYRFAQNNLGIIDKELTFTSFVERLLQERVPFSNRFILNNAIAHSSYVNYLLLWREHFDHRDIGIYLLEDFRINPQKFMCSLASDLGLDPSFYIDYNFTVENRSYRVKHQAVHRVKRLMSPYIKSEKARKFLGTLYRSANVGVLPTIDDDEKLVMKHLAQCFENVNSRLETEFGLDLSSWNSRSAI
ncbi:sulfotransferase domain-containing protein [Haliea sp. E17]|uniref:sulfotransferase domain-containing protein n=1 Tax=Haliea sp. E17 TaxID=3401576 RepID=UPI003AAB194F